MKPYYYIKRHALTRNVARSETLNDAISIASQYAANSPGEAYEILQCIGIVQTPAPPKPSTFWMDGFGPPIEIQLEPPPWIAPFPPVPNGYSKWIYRGKGWSNGRACYSVCAVDEPHEWVGAMHGKPFGIENYHYIEAVK